jgi:hypothetical protein
MCLVRFRELRASLPQDQTSALILKIVDFLMENGNVERAVAVCDEFGNSETWKDIVSSFKSRNKLDVIAPSVPLENPCWTIDDRTEMLTVLSAGPAQAFCARFDKLPDEAFRPEALLERIRCGSQQDPGFLAPLMRVYHIQGDHSAAFETALSMDPPYPGFFRDLVEYRQLKFVMGERSSHFGAVLRAYPDTFAAFLLDHLAELEPVQVIRQINYELEMAARATNSLAATEVVERFKLDYLDQLYENGNPLFELEQNGTELALLYVKFKSPKTMKFITENAFNLLTVREAAVAQGMYPEAAFLFKRGGDATGGMTIYLERIRDPQGAIEYAKGCYVERPVRGRRGQKRKKPDKEVWGMLIKYSYRDPAYLTAMLMELPNMDWKPKHSVRFIEGIPNTAIVPNFEDLASRTVKEYRRKLTTAKLTQEIVATDAFGAFKRSFDRYRSGKPTQFY